MIEELGPKLAIGTDGLQWIVLKRKGERWRACGFVHSDKRALIACIEAKGLKLSAAGRAALNRQGDRIWRWRTHADGVNAKAVFPVPALLSPGACQPERALRVVDPCQQSLGLDREGLGGQRLRRGAA